MTAIDKGIPVSHDAMYSRYGLPEPRDKEDRFIKEKTASGFDLSDSNQPANSKKKVHTPRPLIRIM
jgi:hypothetical protein